MINYTNDYVENADYKTSFMWTRASNGDSPDYTGSITVSQGSCGKAQWMCESDSLSSDVELDQTEHSRAAMVSVL